MKKHFLFRLITLFLVIATVLTFTACGDDKTSTQNGVDEGSAFDELIECIQKNAYFPLPEDFDPTGLSVTEIVAATNDPYATYFTATEYEAYRSDLQGHMVGIGVSVTDYNVEEEFFGILLLSAWENAPAAAAGLKAGDILTHVDGISVAEVGYRNAMARITGAADTNVTLTYLRDGNEHTTTVTRNACDKATVFSRILTKNNVRVGYVYITGFDAVTLSQFIYAVEGLKAAGIDRLLFDLRGNTGGYLQTVCEMLAYVLPDGDICSIDYANKAVKRDVITASGEILVSKWTQSTLKNGEALPVSHDLADIPIGILTDGGTASAAELFTAALRDYAADGKMDVTIFGSKTYGKGCMQSTFHLSNDDWVKLTTALYNPPCGTNYDGIGITPAPENMIKDAPMSVIPRYYGDSAVITAEDPALTFALTTLTATTN